MLRPFGAPREFRPREALGLLDIGLVEGVDAQALAQLPRRVLPREELCAQVEWVARELGDDLRIRPALAHGIVDDGDDAAALLAAALGHELLDPVGEARDRAWRPQHQLVPSCLRRRRDARPEGFGAVDAHGPRP